MTTKTKSTKTRVKAQGLGNRHKAQPPAVYPKPATLGPLDPGRLLKIDEAAARLTVSTATLRRLIDAGQLPAVKIGKLIRVRPTDLEAFVAKNVATLG